MIHYSLLENKLLLSKIYTHEVIKKRNELLHHAARWKLKTGENKMQIGRLMAFRVYGNLNLNDIFVMKTQLNIK
jgi:hypothetical protein